MFLTTKALVLREVKYKEADRILTILTEDEGKLTAKAPGALRKTSKFSASTQLFTWAELTLFGNRGHWTVREGSVIEAFEGLRTDLEAMAIASYIVQVLETVSDEDAPDPQVLQLGLNSLYALSRGLCEQSQVKAAFELRLMSLAGFAPELDRCVLCGRTEGDMRFSAGHGGLLCPDCGRYADPVSPACLAAMRHVTGAPAKKVFSFSLTGDAAREFSVICEGYLLTCLERNFPALEYYKKIKG